MVLPDSADCCGQSREFYGCKTGKPFNKKKNISHLKSRNFFQIFHVKLCPKSLMKITKKFQENFLERFLSLILLENET